MKRWLFATLAAMIAWALLRRAVARLFGRPSARSSSLVAVITQWLAAYILWSFAGALGLHFGVLSVYQPGLFLGVAVLAGIGQYRARLSAGAERGRIVFVAAQLVWLAIVAVQNGIL